jgi:hypothetical protein
VTAENLYLVHPELVGRGLRENGGRGGKGENYCFHRVFLSIGVAAAGLGSPAAAGVDG